MEAIFLTDWSERYDLVYGPEERKRFTAKVDTPDKLFFSEDILANPEKFRDVRYIFTTWGMPEFTEEQIKEIFPKLEAIFYAAGSVQSFARPFLRCGVKIFSAWQAGAIPVAEYTLAQILLATKGYFRAATLCSNGDYLQARQVRFQYPCNYGVRVGIIGLGAIGDLVCQLLKPFDIEVVAYSRSLTQERADRMGVEKSDIETIFKTCHVVSNHIANNAHTQGIFKKEHFASMLPNAVFLNTGRGAQVVEEDLVEVLRNRPDLTAVLDVTDPEPPLENSPFYSLSNCILTPHIAGCNGLELRRNTKWMEEEFDLYRAGKPCRYEVTEDMLERMA